MDSFNSRPNSVSSNSLDPQLALYYHNNNSTSSANHFYHDFSPNMTSQSLLFNPDISGPTLHPNPVMASGPAYPMGATQPPIAGQQFWGPNADYLSQYYSQYYREYYRRYVQQRQQQQHFNAMTPRERERAVRPPLKYGSHTCHARAVFSRHDSSLIVVDNSRTTGGGTRQLFVYTLNDLLIDYLFPKQFFHLLLRGTDASSHLPFRARDLCLEWIRCKQELSGSEEEMKFELKLVLKVIQTLLKQNSAVTGLDLSELLFELLDSEELNRRLSSMSNDFLDNYRLLLLRGQRRVALNYALQTGLYDHALTLAYLTQTLDNNNSNNDLMLATVRRVLQSSLLPDDPLTVLYSCLANAIQRKTNNVLMELSFESFLILLANEMDLNQIQVKDTSAHTFGHLLALIKNLTKRGTTCAEEEFVLSEELFQNEMDCLLINECLEFSRFQGQRFNSRLIQQKLKFLSLLFDFGFVSTARDYCRQLKSFNSDLAPNVRRIVNELETRFDSSLMFSEMQFRDDDIHDSSSPNEATVDDSRQQRVGVEQENNTQTTTDDSNSAEEMRREEVISSELDSGRNGFVSETPLATNNAFDYYDVVSNQNNSSLPSIPMTNGFDGNSWGQNSLAFISTQNSNSVQTSDVLSDDYVTRRESEEKERKSSVSFANNTSFNGFENNNNSKSDVTSSSSSMDGKSARESDHKKTTTNGQTSGLLSKLFNFRPKNQAILPDDRPENKTIVWDDVTQQYIDKSEQQSGGHVNTTPRAPPMGAPPAMGGVVGSGGAAKKFDIRSQKRYVNIWDKNSLK